MRAFQDGINFISKLSWEKLQNIGQNYLSYLYSRFNRQTKHSAYPFSISIEPTTSCNLRCPECPSGLRSFHRPTGMLEPTLFKNIIDQLQQKLAYLIFYFQGEPFLHPNFLDLVQYASGKKIYTATSTNGHFLTKENAEKTVLSGLDRLIISIDGTSQGTYQSYRIGGKLEKVLEGAKNLVEARRKLRSRTPYIIFQFLVVKPNEHQIPEIRRLAKTIGVDEVKLKTAQIYDYEFGNPLIPVQEKYSRYTKMPDGRYRIKNKLLDHCWKMWHSCVVTWDGKIVPCCFDKDAHLVMGNLSSEPFAKIWNNSNYQAFRSKLLGARSNIEMCKNCTEGTKVWA